MVPRFTEGVVAEVKGFAPRRAAAGAPPIPIVDDGLDREEMPAGRGESGRQRRVNCARECVEAHVRIARRQKVFVLERARFVVQTELVEADVP